MEELIAKFTLEENEPLKVNFSVTENEPMQAKFVVDLTPSKVSQLQNDLGFITELDIDEDFVTKQDLTDGLATKQPTGDYALKSEVPKVPTKVSEFENDTGYLTEHQDISELATKEELDTKQDIVADLEIIRMGAAKGETAVQPNALKSYVPTSRTINNKELTTNIVLSAGDVSALPDSTNYGATLSASIDNINYILTLTLKDQKGNVLGTPATVDLPLESVVVSGSYNNETKEVVLSLQNGSEIKFSVADLVSGLQPEITDLAEIRSGAEKGKTAVQPSELSVYAKDADVLHKDKEETITGLKVFQVRPVYGLAYEKRLPDGYTELDAIRFNGGSEGNFSCFIDTGIVPDGTIEFEVKYTYENLGPGVASGQGVILGSRINSTSWVCSVSGFQTFPTGYFGFNNNERRQAYLVRGLNTLSLRTPEGRPDVAIYTSINDSLGTNTYEVTRGTYPTNLPTFYLGALHDNSFAGGASENLNGMVFYCKIWKGGVLVRDFVPCVDKFDGVAGMYDLVSNTMFKNKGTTDITAGNPYEDEFAVKTDILPISTKIVQLGTTVSRKQDIIADLGTIRSGASKGATAVQPATLNNYTTKEYVDQQVGDIETLKTELADKTDIPNIVTQSGSTVTINSAVPNTVYKCDTISSLTITTVPDSCLPIVLIFTTGSATPSINLPATLDSVNISKGFESGKKYVLAIENNIAVMGVIE